MRSRGWLVLCAVLAVLACTHAASTSAARSRHSHRAFHSDRSHSWSHSNYDADAEYRDGVSNDRSEPAPREAEPHPLAVSEPRFSEAHVNTSHQTKEGDFGPCKTCVFVVERIKKGTNMLLPAICSEIYISYPDAYAMCHQVLNSLSLNGNNVRYWLFEGCYKYEIYQAKEWVKPCPTHVMCTVLKSLDNNPFCKPLPMEDPFADDG